MGRLFINALDHENTKKIANKIFIVDKTGLVK